MKKLQMVDLKGQYKRIKNEIDAAILSCVDAAAFINGPEVGVFSTALSKYLNVSKVIPCANGTDALQIAMMTLGLKRGDEVIVPSFTYIATAEVIGLLGLVPVMVDVNPDTFNITVDNIRPAITERTKAIVPVHLFGQSADMESIMQLATEHNLYVIEDTAQAIGAEYTWSDGRKQKVGTIGHIGCTSFFPSKNLGCYGDGGAIFTNDVTLGEKLQIIANHGQEKKYVHKCIGVNSRLDTIQAAILNVKLQYLDDYISARQSAADYYDQHLKNLAGVTIPGRSKFSSHVFHQYTLKVHEGLRDQLKSFLQKMDIPTMIYYPLPLNEQEAYHTISFIPGALNVSKKLCEEVLSLPIHTEMTTEQLAFIVDGIKQFYSQKEMPSSKKMSINQ